MSRGAAPSPAVSVLMAVRDGATYLSETIDSLAAMDAPEGGLEFVVVDDASADATPRILAGWAERDARVRIVTATETLGLPTALNTGLAEARAPLIARADADDLYAPDRLVRQAARLTAEETLGVLSCGYTRIGPDGADIDIFAPPTGPDILRFRMMFMNPLLHSGVMFRARIVQAAGGYDPAYWTAQDSDLWARLAPATAMDNLSGTLVRYRVHPDSVMKKRGEEGRALSLTIPTRLQEAYLGGLPQDHDVAATVDLYQGFKPMTAEALRRGLAGLRRIEAVAAGRETPAVMRDFMAQSAGSMLRHARWMKRRAPTTALTLLTRAAAWRLDAWKTRRDAAERIQ